LKKGFDGLVFTGASGVAPVSHDGEGTAGAEQEEGLVQCGQGGFEGSGEVVIALGQVAQIKNDHGETSADSAGKEGAEVGVIAPEEADGVEEVVGGEKVAGLAEGGLLNIHGKDMAARLDGFGEGEGVAARAGGGIQSPIAGGQKRLPAMVGDGRERAGGWCGSGISQWV
jgi:hypothetical protein